MGGVSIVYLVELGMRIFLPAANSINPFLQDTSKMQSAFDWGIMKMHESPHIPLSVYEFYSVKLVESGECHIQSIVKS